ncbi:nuclear transport factor 2 family protein [Saccharomonospora sp. NPDC046836]|uniref:nuclear transport factor 2 family protein n=1 Tax=Saccharomonospora sp. NPDC046836 TaxID=3156921 RepID=UPI0033CDA465
MTKNPATLRSPRAVFEAQLRAVTGKEWDTVSQFYAEDAVVEQPYAKPQELRLVGRGEIERHFAGAAGLPLDMHARDLVVHETTDPELIVAECDYDVTVTTNGRQFTMHNIFVVRVRDGRIVWSRDYHDPTMLALAAG